jgi:hypothetical protein
MNQMGELLGHFQLPDANRPKVTVSVRAVKECIGPQLSYQMKTNPRVHGDAFPVQIWARNTSPQTRRSHLE